MKPSQFHNQTIHSYITGIHENDFGARLRCGGFTTRYSFIYGNVYWCACPPRPSLFTSVGLRRTDLREFRLYSEQYGKKEQEIAQKTTNGHEFRLFCGTVLEIINNA